MKDSGFLGRHIFGADTSPGLWPPRLGYDPPTWVHGPPVTRGRVRHRLPLPLFPRPPGIVQGLGAGIPNELPP
jgi:hypothetical protein